MEKSLETSLVEHTSWVKQGLRNHQGGVNSVSQIYEDSDMVPACWLCGIVGHGGVSENNSLCQNFYLGESCSFSSYPNARQFSFAPYVPGAFGVDSQFQNSEGGRESLPGLFNSNLLGSQESSISLSLNPPWFLQPDIMRTYFPGTSCFSRGNL